MSNTLFWNVRGLNESSKYSPLSDWLSTRSVSFEALLEMHVHEVNKHFVLSALGQVWFRLDNYQHSGLRKIWIIYKAPVQVTFLYADLHSITCNVTLEDDTNFFYTAIDGANVEEVCIELWISLRDTNASFGLSSAPWIILGNFNEILHPSETTNSCITRTSRSMRLFEECLGDLGLFDLPATSPTFTWTNKCPSQPVWKKIDRCLVNGAWLQQVHSSHCLFQAPEFSDHTPCLVKLQTPPPAF